MSFRPAGWQDDSLAARDAARAFEPAPALADTC